MNTDSSERPAAFLRAFEDQDVSGLLALWDVESGWGQLIEAQWSSWYVDSLCGPVIIAVAEDEQGAIDGVRLWDDAGDPRLVNEHSGSGIVLSNVRRRAIRRCVAWNNGAASRNRLGGPYGIWT